MLDKYLIPFAICRAYDIISLIESNGSICWSESEGGGRFERKNCRKFPCGAYSTTT